MDCLQQAHSPPCFSRRSPPPCDSRPSSSSLHPCARRRTAAAALRPPGVEPPCLWPLFSQPPRAAARACLPTLAERSPQEYVIFAASATTLGPPFRRTGHPPGPEGT